MKSSIVALSILLLAGISGCADGGPVGTGIGTAAISGNVVGTGGDNPSVPDNPIRISIDELEGVETTTDENGNFQLSGDFSGTVTLRFTSEESSATHPVDVPESSNVVLQDVLVRGNGVAVDTVRLLGFYGRIAMIDCDDGTILVDDRHPQPNQFLVSLTDETVLVRVNGRPLACEDLAAGEAIAIEGVIQFEQRTIVAVTVTAGPQRPGNSPTMIDFRFRGQAVVIACEGSMILLDDPITGRTRLRLSGETRITDTASQELSCDDIVRGAHIEGQGRINIRRPGVITARTLIVTPPD